MFARIYTQYIDAPALLAVPLRESQLTQRNLHFDDVTRVRNLSGGVPDGVPRIVFSLVHVIIGQVHLHTQRIRKELERATRIAIGVQHNADEVIVVRRIAVAQVGANGGWIRILRVKRDVQVVAVFNEVGNGLHTRRNVFAGICFDVNIDLKCILPGVVVEDTVDADCLLRARKLIDTCVGQRWQRQKEYQARGLSGL